MNKNPERNPDLYQRKPKTAFFRTVGVIRTRYEKLSHARSFKRAFKLDWG